MYIKATLKNEKNNWEIFFLKIHLVENWKYFQWIKNSYYNLKYTDDNVINFKYYKLYPLHRPLHTQIRIVENLTIVVIFLGGGLAEFGSQLIIK